jgi:hypothetical protein
MFSLRKTIEECIETFNELAKKVFARHSALSSSVLSRFRGLLSSLLTDSLYGATEMEASVQRAYGEHTRLFGAPEGSLITSGSKYAVTTMSVSESKLCLLTNYNGMGTRRKDCGKAIIPLLLDISG